MLTMVQDSEELLANMAQEYEAADENLRQTLPPVVNALLSIFPYLLEAQIEIQNTLLAHCYTTLHNYCQDNSLPSPAPEIEEIIAVWSGDFNSLRMEAEGGLKIISTGKTIHQPMDSASAGGKKSYSGMNIRNNIAARRTTSQTSTGSKPAMQSPNGRPTIQSNPSYRNGGPPSPQPPPMDMASKPRMGSYSSTTSGGLRTPGDGIIRMASNNSLSSYPSRSPGPEQQDDYFSNARPTGTGNPFSSTPIVAGKKKPPPPPPKKFPSQQGQFVTALYDFEGQGDGDLAFREGDRIKIVKKTASEMDWWEGELRGRVGAFPANYCKIA